MRRKIIFCRSTFIVFLRSRSPSGSVVVGVVGTKYSGWPLRTTHVDVVGVCFFFKI